MENNRNININEHESLLFSQIKPVLTGGINQELLTDSHKSMGAELICAICLEIVYEPVMCSSCENLFCKNCIEKLLAKSKKCPNQCKFVEKDKNIMLKRLLNKIEFKCLNNGNGCGTIIPYSDFMMHICNCEFGNFKCLAIDCEFIDIKNKVLEHIEDCLFRQFPCEYCEVNYPRKDLNDHKEICGNTPIKCQFCNIDVIRKEYKSHVNICDYFEIKCNECNMLIKRLNFSVHDRVKCLETQVGYWKDRCNNLQIEKNELENKLKISEKNNSNIIKSSNPMEKPSFSNVSSISNSSNMLAEYMNSIDEQAIDNIANDYSTTAIQTLKNLSGLVYSIIDLHAYKSNLAACGNFSSILLFNSFTCEKISTLDGHTSYIWSLVHLIKYNPAYLASGSQDNTIRIWDLGTKTCITVLTGHSNWVTAVSALACKSNYLLSASYDHSLRIWDLATSECIKQINNIFGKSCLNAHYIKDSLILHGASGNNILVHDYDSDVIKYTLKGHTNLINCFVNLGEYNSNLVASGSDDKTIKVWNLSNGSLVKTLIGHNQCITFLTHLYRYDKNILMSGSDDHTIRLWNLNTFECKGILKIHSSWVKSILPLSSNPENFLSHGDTGIIKLSKLEKVL
jgi:WD40 repeat protein